MRIMITGDRSLRRDVAVGAVAGLALANALWEDDVTVVTGRRMGVEGAVRSVFRSAEVFGTDGTTDEDFDASFEAARAAGLDAVVFVHTAPFESRVYRSLLRVFGDDDDMVRLFP